MSEVHGAEFGCGVLIMVIHIAGSSTYLGDELSCCQSVWISKGEINYVSHLHRSLLISTCFLFTTVLDISFLALSCSHSSFLGLSPPKKE